jgi:cell division transport system ATP-binding protein
MIRFYNVYKTYGRGVHALIGINAQIDKGEFVFLVGPSGAGKTTFLKMVYREELPTQGQVLVNRLSVAKLKASEIPYFRRKIGVVFQDLKLLSHKTAFENVSFAQEVIGIPRAEAKSKTAEILRLVGLGGKMNLRPDQLSKGEMQRVAIARALVNDPLVLLADEPTGNIDLETSLEIMELLRGASSRGTTVVVATHNREIISRFKGRVIHLADGRVSDDGKVS